MSSAISSRLRTLRVGVAASAAGDAASAAGAEGDAGPGGAFGRRAVPRLGVLLFDGLAAAGRVAGAGGAAAGAPGETAGESSASDAAPWDGIVR